MARNRMIRPELWSNEQFVELSPTARLLYIAMWNFSDDGGNHPASPKTLKMEVFPGDDITAAEIQTLVQEIIAHGLITPYQADDRQYWHITNWNNLQKIDRPNPTHPKPFAEHSPNDNRQFAENAQIREEKEIKERREAREHTPAHEAENSNQKNTPFDDDTTPATPPQPSNGGGGITPNPFDYAIAAINAWARPDNWQPLRDYAASVGYDPAQYGPVSDEVKKFTAHWLDTRRHPDDRATFQADPARFFQEKGRKWLLDAKNMNRQKPAKDQRPKYEPPQPHQRQQPRTNGSNATPTTIGDIAGKIITEMT